MTALMLAVSCAAVWGTADFCGGKATRHASALAVTVLSKIAVLPILAVALAVTGGAPRAASLGWGGLAGVFGMAGLILLYRGLAAGAMTVVAPVTAVTSALVPFLIGLALDGVPPPLTVAGAACAVAAIALVSMGPGGGATAIRPSLLATALASGLGFGLFLVFFDRAGHAATGPDLWPLAAAQCTSLALGGFLLWRVPWRGGDRPRLAGRTLHWTLLAGVLDLTANLLYLLAARHGLLSVVAPVASLYPASTVLLALAVDRERVRPVQVAGLGLAAGALVLVAS